MKKKIFSAYDIIFIISVIAVFVYAVFVPPVHSVADQGDFERVMRPCGLDFPSDYSFYDYAVRFFNMKFFLGKRFCKGKKLVYYLFFCIFCIRDSFYLSTVEFLPVIDNCRIIQKRV